MKNAGAVLLLIGKGVGLATGLISVGLSLLITTEAIGHDAARTVYSVLPFLSIPASFLFAFGFIRIAKAIESAA
jgi:hypothetical protein